jgi:L-asparaginase/Glu-tRNA(Gln) amidotransferase subunit D
MFNPAPIYQSIDFKHIQSTLAHAIMEKIAKQRLNSVLILNSTETINETIFLHIILLTKSKGTCIN